MDSNESFRSLAFYGGILAVKMFCMSGATSLNRVFRNVYANQEDIQRRGDKIILNDPVVERIRRAHQNDSAYCCTNPNPGTALLLFRTFTGARLLHTFVYNIFIVKQPARFIIYLVGQACNIFMAYKVITHFM